MLFQVLLNHVQDGELLVGADEKVLVVVELGAELLILKVLVLREHLHVGGLGAGAWALGARNTVPARRIALIH